MTSPQPSLPSEKSRKILETLKKAVSQTLDRKRRLGQYAVVWDGQKPVRRGGDTPDAKD